MFILPEQKPKGRISNGRDDARTSIPGLALETCSRHQLKLREGGAEAGADATPPFVELKTTEVHSLLGCVTTLLTASLQLQSRPVCRFLCCLSSYASPDVLGVSLLEESQASKDQTPLGVSMVLECRWPHNQPRLNRVILFSVDRGYFGSLRSVYAHTKCFRWRPGGPAPLGAGPASKRDQVVQCHVPRGTPPRAGDPAADSLPARTLRCRQSLALSVRPPSSGLSVSLVSYATEMQSRVN
ncbi:uncharacterized protein LOC141931620 isoform X2 [Strix aluco]|uniref:uncharacterized protein LOC141931620 isoform X2 n=1 Tax=Strix aluco TaxID=111821 RepID=UPI003DA55BFA